MLAKDFTNLVIDFILQVAFLLYELVLKLLATRFKYEFVQLPFDLDTKYTLICFLFRPPIGLLFTSVLF